MKSGEITTDGSFTMHARKKSAEELMARIGTNRTPTVYEIIDYLKDKAKFHPAGMMSTDSYYVNKEALRLAVVYLQDAYCDK